MTCPHFQKQLDHLTRVSSMEFRACKVYAWQRAKVLDADPSGLFLGMAAALEQAVKTGQAAPMELGALQPLKPP